MAPSPRATADRGYSLVELLVVVILVSILASIAIPLYLSQRRAAQDAATVADLRALSTAMMTVPSGGGGKGMASAVTVNRANTQLTRLGDAQSTLAPKVLFAGTGDGTAEGVDIFLGEPVAEGELCLVGRWSSSDRWFTFSLARGGMLPDPSPDYPSAVARCQQPG